MQMIHTSLGRSKKRKPNAKQRELKASWEALLKKYELNDRLEKLPNWIQTIILLLHVLMSAALAASLLWILDWVWQLVKKILFTLVQ